ncbi:MAG: hypothetical protein ACOZQL_37480 [Myxococcota bacterium]
MLREDQIQRYSRQILLREVGGRGQAKLLATSIELVGSSPELDVAAAYLAAGGTPIQLDSPVGGFVAGASLDALSPDARASSAPQLTLAAAPVFRPAQVVVTARSVSWRLASACPRCGWQDSVGPAGNSVLLGALAALVVQRFALGQLEPLGHLVWDGAGFRPAVMRCVEHQISQ